MHKRRTVACIAFLFAAYVLYGNYGAFMRYRLEITTADNRLVKAYYYLPDSVSNKYSTDEDFLVFALKNEIFPLVIYKQVKSLEILENFDVEFFEKNMRSRCYQDSIRHISVIEQKRYPSGIEFVEVSSLEFQTIQQFPFHRTIIFNDDLSVECAFYMLGWSSEMALYRKKFKLHIKINRFIRKGKYEEAFTYVEQMKPGLLKRGIIIFYHCDNMTEQFISIE